MVLPFLPDIKVDLHQVGAEVEDDEDEEHYAAEDGKVGLEAEG